MAIDSPFGLSIHLTRAEHSKDAHCNTFDVLVDGAHVRYRGPYGEGTRGQFDTATREFDLCDGQVATLRREVDNYDLHQSVDETFETDTGGLPHRTVEAEATVVVDGDRHELHIEGPTGIRGQSTGMEHHEQARGLERVCWQCREYAEASGRWWHPFEE